MMELFKDTVLITACFQYAYLMFMLLLTAVIDDGLHIESRTHLRFVVLLAVIVFIVLAVKEYL